MDAAVETDASAIPATGLGVRRKTWALLVSVLFCLGMARGADVAGIRHRGVLRHMGVPYPGFVTGSGDGLDTELIQRFAEFLGVRYEFVHAGTPEALLSLDWVEGRDAGFSSNAPGKAHPWGDLIAAGVTILPERQAVVDFSIPTFLTQVWLVARADSEVQPIRPGKDVRDDIAAVRVLLRGRTILGKRGTSLDPDLYGLKDAGAEIKLFAGNLNEMVPAIINHQAEMTLLDLTNALTGLRKWAGYIKVVGPVSEVQEMGVAFPKDSPALRAEFNRFFTAFRRDGRYAELVRTYFPEILACYREFFAACPAESAIRQQD